MKYPGDFVDKILCGDCLELMRALPNNVVDLVNTDPPYNVGKDYGIYKDQLDISAYWNWYREVFSEVFRVLKQGYLYVSCTDYQQNDIKNILTGIGFDYIQTLIWYRPNMCGGTVKITLPWSRFYEPILMFKKGKRKPMLNSGHHHALSHNVLIHSAPQSNYRKNKRYHITQKPVDLYFHLLSRTPGDIVLDPFLGSGTTALACRKLDRHFIGMEINSKFCEITRSRLESKPITINSFLEVTN